MNCVTNYKINIYACYFIISASLTMYIAVFKGKLSFCQVRNIDLYDAGT
jgi:hypothetical protein